MEKTVKQRFVKAKAIDGSVHLCSVESTNRYGKDFFVASHVRYERQAFQQASYGYEELNDKTYIAIDHVVKFSFVEVEVDDA